MTLRICDGGVSSEQRRSNGCSAAIAPVRSAGAAATAIAEATNVRRDNDRSMFLLLVSVHLAAAADGRSILLVGIERLRFDAMRLRSRRGRYPRVQPIQVVQRM